VATAEELSQLTKATKEQILGMMTYHISMGKSAIEAENFTKQSIALANSIRLANGSQMQASMAGRLLEQVGEGSNLIEARVRRAPGQLDDVGVTVGDVVLHPLMALHTLRRPPVVVLPASPETASTLLRMALLSCATVQLPCPAAERIKAAAPVTIGVLDLCHDEPPQGAVAIVREAGDRRRGRQPGKLVDVACWRIPVRLHDPLSWTDRSAE